MFMQADAMPGKLEEEFSRPVESIMRCEDFKSNFARRLSNRYTSKAPVAAARTDVVKPRPDHSEATDNVSLHSAISTLLATRYYTYCATQYSLYYYLSVVTLVCFIYLKYKRNGPVPG